MDNKRLHLVSSNEKTNLRKTNAWKSRDMSEIDEMGNAHVLIYVCFLVFFVFCSEEQLPPVILSLPVSYRETSPTAPLISQILTLTTDSNPIADITHFCIRCGLDDGFCSALIAEISKELVSSAPLVSSPLISAVNHTTIALEAHPYRPDASIVYISHVSRCISYLFVRFEDASLARLCAFASLSVIDCTYISYDITSLVFASAHSLPLSSYISSMPLPDASSSVLLPPIARIVNASLVSLPEVILTPFAADSAVLVASYCSANALFRDECRVVVLSAAAALVRHFGSDRAASYLDSLQLLLLFIDVLDDKQSISSSSTHFIEVGTSDFNTLLQLVDEEERMSHSFSVEPLRVYTSDLPSREGVTVLNIALGEGETDTVPIYYIPPSAIAEHNLPAYLKGCNSIFKRHVAHASLLQYVVEEHVPLVSISDFMDAYNIQHIRLLKIDAEGADIDILESLRHYYVSKHVPVELWVDIVVFESSSVLHDLSKMISAVSHWLAAGYYVASKKFAADTVLHKTSLRKQDRHIFQDILTRI